MERNGVIGPREGLRATIGYARPGPEQPELRCGTNSSTACASSQPTAPSKARVIASDDLVEGKQVSEFQPYGGISVAPGPMVTVRQIPLSDAGYRYYVALTDQVVNGGSPSRWPRPACAATSPTARARRGAR
ncbi:MAG: hypothetical protein IPK33_13705 [Gemmatimonadetes bacterium]|nr:hypothetical protein [Gemmatimonadota bacterium]